MDLTLTGIFDLHLVHTDKSNAPVPSNMSSEHLLKPTLSSRIVEITVERSQIGNIQLRGLEFVCVTVSDRFLLARVAAYLL